MIASPRFAAFRLFLLIPLACGGENDADPGTAGRGGSAGAAHAGSSGSPGGGRAGNGGGPSGGTAGTGSGAAPSGPPLLERPATLEYDCTVSRPMTLLGIDPWRSPALLAGDDGAALLRIEGDYGLSVSVSWSSLGFDGSLGARKDMYRPTVETMAVNGLEAIVTPSGASVVWAESASDDSGRITLARIDSNGAVTGDPINIPSIGKSPSQLQLLQAHAATALTWTEHSGTGTSRLQFTKVDATGEAEPPRTLAEAAGWLQPSSWVALESGFLLSYTKGEYTTGPGAWVMRLDADGAPVGDPWKLGNGVAMTSILPRGDDGFLIAWVEETGRFDTAIQRTIRASRIDATGNRVGDIFELQAPEKDVEHVHPTWVDLGDDVGLVWSQGSVIYICAGCFPDNELRFVVLDGETLAPRSAVLELPSPIENGLLRPRATVDGDDILLIADVTHHVKAEGASATLRCAR